MKDFVYDGGVRIIYGTNQKKMVAEEIAKLGKRVLVVSTGSFVSGGHYEELKSTLTAAGLEVFCLKAGKLPLLSKVNEGVSLCTQESIEVVLGIGGGVSMDLAKTIAFAALHTDVPMEKYLTYECSTEGLSQLSVVTIPTNPMSGSETNPDVQITIDETGMQKALDALKKLYQEFGIAFTYGEMAEDPKDHEKLVSIIDSFGPMPCQIMPVTSESLAEMIEDAIVGNLH